MSNIHSAKERLNSIIKLVDESTIDHKKNRKPLLIEDTVDVYAVKTKPILEIEEKNIEYTSIKNCDMLQIQKPLIQLLPHVGG